VGLTRGTRAAHIARAALQAIALQTVDLVRAMEQDSGRTLTALRVDGGATTNNLLMQIQADLLDADIVRPAQVEVTALGVARLAAAGVGLDIDPRGEIGGEATVFHPRISAGERDGILARWRDALGPTAAIGNADRP
jgi:glycerol kinase